jgi:hypothetical protein
MSSPWSAVDYYMPADSAVFSNKSADSLLQVCEVRGGLLQVGRARDITRGRQVQEVEAPDAE